MDPLHDFDQDLRWVLDSSRNQIMLYPPIFQETALHYWERYNIFDENFHRNYIFYVLPFWIGQAFAIDSDTCRKMSLASLLNFFYILVQDAVMDTGPGEYKADLLPLGNLFYLDSLRLYQELFPEDSVFWRYLRKYFLEWAESTLWEREEFWKKHRIMTETDLEIVAHKAATVKIINAAMSILSGRPEAIETLDIITDKILITSQFLDDWIDWREDLSQGNCTYMLSKVMQYHQTNQFSILTESLVKKAILFHDILDEIFAVAQKNHTLMKEVQEPQVPYLIFFHEILVNALQEMVGRIRKQKKEVLAGGFSQWLAKQQPLSES